MSRLISGLVIAAVVFAAAFGYGVAAKPKPLVVHEWGTFTVLQDEAGRPIGGINVDDEPLPPFVHRIVEHMLAPDGDLAPAYYFKGLPFYQAYRDVTMRLETPVIYFYPPHGAATPMKADVRASFRGGWLSEFYPEAAWQAPGIVINGKEVTIHGLRSDTVGTLTWENLSIGTAGDEPKTDQQVWLAPRKVAAANVTASNSESERYLFYRGVGHVNAPIRVVRDAERDELRFHAQLDPAMKLAEPLPIHHAWLVDIGEHALRDGAAYRRLDPMTLTQDGDHVMASTAATFKPEEYRVTRMMEFRAEMRRALIAEGLFEDEAEAMLNTWHHSYFQTPGLRVFFTVPRAITDGVLPLEVSSAYEPQITRVMIGRVELVTPRHRQLLRTIAAGPTTDTYFMFDQLKNRPESERSELLTKLFSRQIGLRRMGIDIPADYAAYLDLGRFRNALVLDEAARRPTPALKQFTENFGLRYLEPGESQ